MFERIVEIGNRKVVMNLQQEPAVSTPEYLLCGCPLGDDLFHLNINKLSNALQSVSGYFCYFAVDENRLTVATDITGGFRIYRYDSGNITYLSDDYTLLLNCLRADSAVAIDEWELTYWRKHRYTTGARTFIRGIDKISPATTVIFTDEGDQAQCWFPQLTSNGSATAHCAEGTAALEKTLRLAAGSGGKVLLLFSGGADSTALAALMMKHDIEFTPVFFLSQPGYEQNLQDADRATRAAKRLGLSLTTLTVDIEPELECGLYARAMLFDRHVAVVHFAGMRAIAERFGGDAVIVCGQGADSVLSLGPSQTTKGDLAARVLLFDRNGLLSRLAIAAVKKVYGPGWRRPKGNSAYLKAVFNPFAYYPVVGDCDTTELTHYAANLVDRVTRPFETIESARMYLKIYGFLQGSDNQVVIQAARAAGLSRVVLPFVSPEFILATVAHHNNRREIRQPKYVVTEILKQAGIKPEPKRDVADDTTLIALEELTEWSDRAYERQIQNLTRTASREAGVRA